eukprot:m51a1_g12550 putative calcineurin a (518) ;mRNA; f:503-3044
MSEAAAAAQPQPQQQQQQQDAGASAAAAEQPPAPKRKFNPAFVSTTDRVVSAVPYPAVDPLPHAKLFSGPDGTIDVGVLQEHQLKEGRLMEEDAMWILRSATELLRKEATLLTVEAPLTICGDVHGQYYDLIKLFEVGGAVGKTTYLFLGDYVDRGSFSIEVLLHLYVLKLQHPTTLWLIRGNHECRHLTEYFTFRDECVHKYSEALYDAAIDSFNVLPLAALVNNQFLCIHGGLSPELKTLDDIRKINRFREPPQSGAMCDMLWSDPAEEFSPENNEHYAFNEVRGCSYVYTYHAACAFLERNRLLSLVRAHEAQDEGYRMYRSRQNTGFPTVITIFSAPNYLDAYNNKAAVLRYEKNVLNIRQFNQSPHPYWLPNFMDVFTWSMPFVSEKIAEMLLSFLKIVDDEGKTDMDDDAIDAAEAEKRRQVVREKIRSVSRFMRMYGTLRMERDTIMQIKSLSNSAVLPRGLLMEGSTALKQALHDFKSAQVADRPNEKRPPLERTPSGREMLQSLKGPL